MSKLSRFIDCVYNGLTHTNGYEESVTLVCELFRKQTEAEVFVFQDVQTTHGLAAVAAAILQPSANISLTGLLESKHDNDVAMVVPLYAEKIRLGSFVAMRGREFSCEEQQMGKTAGALLAVNVQALRKEREAADIKDAMAVRAAIGTLSYSELEAVAEMLRRLNGDEGSLVASTIAAESKGKVTRSAIVNSLRKLESAGLLEAHSMGVKGTFIKIKTPALREGLKNL